MSNKKWVLKAVRELPEEASLEEILEHIQIMAKIREGEQAIKEGRFITHEEMVRRMDLWISKLSGPSRRAKPHKLSLTKRRG